MKLRVISGILLLLAVFIASCQSDAEIEFSRYYTGGSQVYLTHCQNCHSAKGEGLQSLIPPLTDSVYLKNNKSSLACYLKNGLKGRITINGKSFEDEMPAEELSPIEIAEVLTYVTNSFGNKLGLYDIQQANTDLARCKQ